MSEGTRPRPDGTGVLAPFWEGVQRGELRLPFCTHCGQSCWPPRGSCPACGGLDVDWRSVDPHGRLATFAVVNRAFHPSMADEVPYVLCVVELEGHVRMLGRLVDGDGRPRIGDPMVARFVDVGDGTTLVYWQLGSPGGRTKEG